MAKRSDQQAGPVSLTAGGETRAPVPEGRRRSPADLPPGRDRLASLSAAQREALLRGLALARHDGGAAAGLDAALATVLEATDGVTLRQTLEVAAARGSLGFLAEAVGLDALLALGGSKGVAVNDVLARTDGVKHRGLTSDEARRVRENFFGTLDPATVRLRFTTGAQTMGAAALVLGNTIHVDPTFPGWGLKAGTTRPEDPDSERWGGFNSTLLAHECAHVWSYQHRGTRYAVDSVSAQAGALASGASRGAAYAYAPGLRSYFDYGEEQRAMMVQDFVAARHALSSGAPTTPTLFGARPPREAVAALQPYMDELRAQGPGQSEPPDAPQPVRCPFRTAPFVQDGVAGQLGASADALLAAVGSSATAAVVDGLRDGRPGTAALGALGVAAAVVASAAPREQNAQGASSGGSALLDQAGVPRGVAVQGGGFQAELRGAWDAPKPSAQFALGFGDPRFELSLGYRTALGLSELAVDADLSVAREGPVRSAGLHAHLDAPAASVDARARLEPQQRDAPLRGTAELEVQAGAVSVDTGGALSSRDGHLTALDAHARLDAPRASVAATTAFAAATPGAPLAFREAALDAALSVTPDFSLSAHAAFNARGLDAVGASVAASRDGLSMAAGVSARALTSVDPKVAFQLSAGARRALLTLTAETSPATGRQDVTVGLKVPLP